MAVLPAQGTKTAAVADHHVVKQLTAHHLRGDCAGCHQKQRLVTARSAAEGLGVAGGVSLCTAMALAAPAIEGGAEKQPRSGFGAVDIAAAQNPWLAQKIDPMERGSRGRQ